MLFLSYICTHTHSRKKSDKKKMKKLKNNERCSACFVKRHYHARGKKIRLNGKSGGLELTEDSPGCVAGEERGE